MASQTEADPEAIKALFERAAAIAKGVPETMQQAAFHRALDILLEQESSPKGSTGRSAKRREKRASSGSVRPRPRKPASAGKSRAARSTRLGARTALRELAQTEFFKTPRIIGEIQRHLERKRALRFTQENLSPHLGVLVREGVLDRDKNEQGVYEYKLP